jgi:hypothetical protein
MTFLVCGHCPSSVNRDFRSLTAAALMRPIMYTLSYSYTYNLLLSSDVIYRASAIASLSPAKENYTGRMGTWFMADPPAHPFRRRREIYYEYNARPLLWWWYSSLKKRNNLRNVDRTWGNSTFYKSAVFPLDCNLNGTNWRATRDCAVCWLLKNISERKGF